MGKNTNRMSITFRSTRVKDAVKKASDKEQRTIAFWVNDAIEQRLKREAKWA